MAKIMKNGIEYGGTIPPLGEGLTINQSTGEIEVSMASEEDIIAIVDGITFDDAPAPIDVYSLAPGAYDRDGNFLKTWESLFEGEGNGYRSVSNGAFYGSEDEWQNMNGVNIVVIPPTINSFGGSDGWYQFALCEDLEAVVIPDTVQDLGSYSPFHVATNLKTVNIPDGITMIPDACFSNCKNLSEVSLPNSVVGFGSSAFVDSGIKKIAIPNGVTEISSSMFYGCSELTEINMHDGITAIRNGAFWSCEKLESITIPEGVTIIEKLAFAYTNLKSIVIPNSVTSIGEDVFYGCDNLTEIHYSGTATGAPWGATNATIVPYEEGL